MQYASPVRIANFKKNIVLIKRLPFFGTQALATTRPAWLVDKKALRRRALFLRYGTVR
jgi:hypothetical protein